MFALLNSFTGWTFASILKRALQIFKQFAGIQNLWCNILTLRNARGLRAVVHLSTSQDRM